jgi:hypothetical protein
MLKQQKQHIVFGEDNLDVEYSIRNTEEVVPKLVNSDVLKDIKMIKRSYWYSGRTIEVLDI